MTILYLHQYFCLPSSSGGTRSYDLAKRFLAAGHEVKVITTSSFLNYTNLRRGWNRIEHEGLEIHVLRLSYNNKMSFFKRTIIFLQFLLAATVKILQLQCDVVLATSTPLTIAIPAVIKKLVHRVPFIFEVRDVWPEVPVAMGIIRNKWLVKLLEVLEAFFYGSAFHIVALSTDMKASILRRTDVDECKITVIPNFAEITRFAEVDASCSFFEKTLGFKPKKILLYAGTLGRVNGLGYLVKLAHCTMRIDSSIIFVIIGDGMEKKQLQEEARVRGILGKNLFFLDQVPKKKLPVLYRECTVASSFVAPVPALWANSANKFFDCLAAGRPILINHLGWQSNVMREKNIGLVLNHRPASMEMEAQVFVEYMNNEELLAAQCFNSLLLGQTLFSLDTASDAYLNIIDHVLFQKQNILS